MKKHLIPILLIILIPQLILSQSIVDYGNLSPDIVSVSTVQGFIEFNSTINIPAERIFDNYGLKMGLDKQSKMIVKSSQVDNLGIRHTRLKQTFNGIPLDGVEFLVHEKLGKPTLANGIYIVNLDLNTQAQISSDMALQKAKEYIAADRYMWEMPNSEAFIKEVTKDENSTFYPKPELVIVGPYLTPELKEYHLAYKMDIYAIEPISYNTIYVDAQTGLILTKINKLHNKNEKGTAVTMFAGEREIVSDHFPGGFRLREVRNGVSIRTMNANNRFDTENLTDFTDTDNYWDNVNGFTDQTATDVHWGSEMTYDYFNTIHNRNSIDDKGMELLSLVHVGQNWSNASWNGTYMSYGDGNGNPFTMMAIVSHELTHGVTQHTAGLIYSYESGALNESFSDIFGVSAMYWADVRNNDGSMIWDIVSRNLADPHKSRDPKVYLGTYWHTAASDNGGVHTNSQVQNHWYFLLVEGGSGKNDLGTEFNVQGIGVEKAEQIAYRTLSYYLVPTSNYFAARNASLMAAEDLFGMCTNEYTQVAEAWKAVGVGGPISDKDVGVFSLKSPTTSCNFLGSEEPLVLELKYFGACSTIPAGTNFPIKFSVNAGDTITEIVTLSKALDGGDKYDYITQATFDFSAQGMYYVDAWTAFAQDTNYVNDKFSKYIYSGYEYSESNDIAITDVLSPQTSCSVLGSNEEVTISIMNMGCDPIPSGSSISLSYNVDGELVQENLILNEDFETKSTINYTFEEFADLSQKSIYNLLVTVDFASDPVEDNNTKSVQIVTGGLTEFPYMEDFESGPSGWNSRSIKGTNNWEWGKPNQQTINKASSGEYAWMTGLDKNHSDASEMHLESPCFDFTTLSNPFICFDSHFKFEKDFDGFVLEYSTDNIDWNRVELPGYNSNLAQTVNFGVPWFSGSNGGWKNYCMYMPELGGEDMVRFRFRLGSDANLNDEGAAIDNFSVQQLLGDDIVVKNLVSPINSCKLVKEEIIEVQLQSFGAELNMTFDISYSIDGGAPVVEQFNGEMPYAELVTFTFVTPVDLSKAGEDYTIVIVADVQGDNTPQNNTLSKVVSNLKQTEPDFSMNFESGEFPENWKLSPTGSGQGWIISDAETMNSMSSGNIWPIPEHTFFAVINDYSINYVRLNDLMIMPPFNLVNSYQPVVEFDAYFLDQLSAMTYLQVSTDDGDNWIVVDSLKPVSKWTRYRFDISEFAGQSCVLAAFKFTDNAARVTGVAIDNILVTEKPYFDLKLNQAYLDPSSCYGKNENVIFEVENIGSVAVSSYKVHCELTFNGGTAILRSAAVGEKIDPGKVATYEFDANLDMSQVGDYTLFAYISQGSDDSQFNDTVAVLEYTNAGIYDQLPFKQTFDDFTRGTPGVLLEGWLNASNDDIDWNVNRGGTPTYYTGPSKNHTPGNGNYLFVESSAPNTLKTAELYSPCIDVSDLETPYLSFWYHMLSSNSQFGDVMGDLFVDIYDGSWHNAVWEISGNQGNNWHNALINLKQFNNIVKIRFRAKTGPAQFSDIAIDDVEVFNKDKVVDLEITDLPKNGCGMTDGTEIAFGVRNIGTEDITGGLKLSYSVGSGNLVEEIYSGTIKSGDEIQYIFKDEVPLSKGNHYLNFYINHPQDNNTANDTIKEHRVISYTELFSNHELTECQGNWAILDASHINGYKSFVWENSGSTNRTIYSDTSGVFVATFEFDNGCILTDSIRVTILPAPSTGLKDTIIENFATIDAGDFESYLWYDGSTERTYYIDDEGEYWVTISDENGCFGTDPFIVSIVNGIDTEFENNLKVMPNPANDFVQVEIYNSIGSNLYLELYSLDGNVMWSKISNGGHIIEYINTSELASGTYYLRISGKNYSKLVKIVVE